MNAIAGAAIYRSEIADFFADYYSCLDDVKLDSWPGFFTEACIYKIIPRENYEAGYALCTMQAESRGMLIDRVMGITRTQMYAPRYYRRFPGPLRIVSQVEGAIRTRHNLLIVQTLIDKQSEVFLTAICHDEMIREAGGLRLRERIVVFDSEMVPNSLIYPA